MTIVTAKAELTEGRKEFLGAYLQAATSITELTIIEWGSAEQALQHSQTIKNRCLPVARVLLAKYTSDYEAGTNRSELSAVKTAKQLHELIIGLLEEKARE